MPYVDPVVDDVLSGYNDLYPSDDSKEVQKLCRLPECHDPGVKKFEGYCVIHWHNLQSWLGRKR